MMSKATIPNTVGFALIVLTEDYTHTPAIVKKRSDGVHYLAYIGTTVEIPITSVKGWFPA